MSYLATLSLVFISTLLITARAANLLVRNNCPYVVWAAASTPVGGGGRRLNTNEEWSFNTPPGTDKSRIWGRTKCNPDGSGCETGDCGRLECTQYGKAPNTLAEYALNQNSPGYYTNLDFFDISLVDGFNIPMEFGPVNNSGGKCEARRCTADINGQCPGKLRVPGGCNNPCTTFKEERYCCNNGPCGPTDLSRFFKDRCPTSYSYPQDDPTSLFTCPGGTNYKVVFCP
ncbi:osmotin-like protein OSML13 [Apium graveolens]|uniref:osmotin-like protein OSML13 n=1 Tax=Apium graveolens TaxID=4045 RepID=UPI003D7B11E7